MSLEDDLRSIQNRRTQVQAKVARATVEYDNAKAKLTTAKQALKEEFEVETNADAKAKLAELEEALEASLSEVQEALERAGA